MLKKGFTKRAAQEISEIKQIQEDNLDIPIYAGIHKYGISYADFNKKAIFLSLTESKIENITVLLHEIGHYRIGYRTKDVIKNEAEAWLFAIEYAKKYDLPFSRNLAFKFIMTYVDAYIACKKYYDLNKRTKRKITEQTYKNFFEKIWLKDFYYKC